MKNNILYYFESDSHILVEVKFDIKNESDKSKIYYWLLYDKYNDKLEIMDFVSIGNDERVFKQGKFNFNSNSGTLVMNNTTINFNRDPLNMENNYKLIRILSDDLLKNKIYFFI
jgi:acetyltransferase-like isoleucine patch superfamily enzyme